VTIRYTTNGSAPSTTSGIVYTPLGVPIASTTLIRAIGYRDGFEPTEVETHSYIFLNQIQAQSTNSNWAGGSSGNYTLVPAITQSPLYGPTFKSDLLGVPTLRGHAGACEPWLLHALQTATVLANNDER